MQAHLLVHAERVVVVRRASAWHGALPLPRPPGPGVRAPSRPPSGGRRCHLFAFPLRMHTAGIWVNAPHPTHARARMRRCRTPHHPRDKQYLLAAARGLGLGALRRGLALGLGLAGRRIGARQLALLARSGRRYCWIRGRGRRGRLQPPSSNHPHRHRAPWLHNRWHSHSSPIVHDWVEA
jgi:hypothetical protein